MRDGEEDHGAHGTRPYGGWATAEVGVTLALLSLALAAGLALVHLFSGRMRFLSASPRSR